MTCIIGLEHNGRVYMGCDSAATTGYHLVSTTSPKVFKNCRLLIGYSWSFRMGQILQFARNYPDIDKFLDNYEFLVSSFIPFVRGIMKDAGFLKIENNQEESGQFMIGIRGQLFGIDSDFSVLRNNFGYDSIGSGKEYALGAMKMLLYSGKINEDPILSIGLALETSAYFCNSVRGPFVFEELGS